MNNENWANKKWRPFAAWNYIVTCSFDFIIFPILWAIFQAKMGNDVTQWNPITLQGAGLYHLSMGAILGVAAWSRGQEKITYMQQSMSYTKRSNIINKDTPPDTDLEDADTKIK
jgi:hypothetical protein